jgi:nucleoside-diphosphate-sugar epimerase
LCKELSNRQFAVKALALPDEDVSHIRDHVLEIRRGDLTAPESFKGICDDVDVVFHLAARVTDWGSVDDFYSSILDATKNILDECLGKASRFLYVSSIAACGLGRHLRGLKEGDEAFKSGIPYNDAKLDTERLVMSYHGKSRIMCTIVRPSNVIGPGSVWVRDVIERFQGLFVPLVDRGKYSASLIHVGNLVEGMILAGTLDIAEGKTYFLRDDWSVTWKEYVTDLGAILGKQPVGSIPFKVAWTGGSILEKILTPFRLRPPVTRLAAGVMGRDNDVDNTRAKQELGWRTRVSYRDAMEEIRRWVLENMV